MAASAAVAAGEAIMNIYNDPDSDFSVERKADNSPLTIADKAAHKVIAAQLEQTLIPVLSEEGAMVDYEQRREWSRLWIVDPLDGTKEFIKRNGEFTVNIALVESGVPIGGVLYVPCSGELFVAQTGVGAYLYNGNLESEGRRLPLDGGGDVVRVVASRSHLSAQTEEFVEQLKANGSQVEFVSKGSSIKIALLATGQADIYPRYAPTMEWDTAAGDALLRALGGGLKVADSDDFLRYNKENLLNPFFVGERVSR